jgi:hypothetical protein
VVVAEDRERADDAGPYFARQSDIVNIAALRRN